MKWNRIGRFAVVLAAGLVLAGGCRSTKTDRIRYLEAENAKVTRENTDLSDQVVAERSGKMKEEARRETAEAELRAARMRYELLLQRENAAMSELDKKDGLDVRTAEDGSKQIFISSDITFRPGQATLTRGAEKTLADVAKVLKERQYRVIRVEGHTDSDPIRKSGWKSNEELSLARAKSVRGALVAQGIPNGVLKVEGYGAKQPMVENKTAAGKAQNRRVVITLVTE
ncbi:MAG: OmpA/MotB family protein [Planctomycetota bacterium]|jgi:chemotaxis protein MotB